TIGSTAYPTVTIGNQIWTTVNYSGPGGYHSETYKQFGDYYSQSEALAITLPTGWRVPSMNDYSVLLSNFTTDKDYYGYYRLLGGGDGLPALQSKSYWGTPGTNASGFNGLPGSLFTIDGQPPTALYFLPGATSGYFITSDSSNQMGMYGFWLSSVSASLGASGNSTVSDTYMSLRFVKDK
ncbi:MAG: hypothetical protein JSU01_17800, partial [Bacteroidetes bacterium]|nr:hypothetical protein [Bacteroidota bacterium]